MKMSIEIKKEIKEILVKIKENGLTFSHDFERLSEELSTRMSQLSHDFVTNQQFVKATKVFFSKSEGYEEDKFNKLISDITPESVIENDFQKELSNQSNTSFVATAGISNGNNQRPVLEDLIDDLEDEIAIQKELNSIDDEYSYKEKCLEYGYRQNKLQTKMFKVDADGNKEFRVANYNPLLQKIEVANSALQSPEVAEINTLLAKNKGWNPVTLTPPNNQLAQEFMEINLRALMNPDFGYLPAEVNVPEEFKPLKAAIAAELHSSASLKQTSVEDIKLQAKEALEDPVVNIEKQPEPELESEVKEAIDLFDNKDDLDFKQESNDDFEAMPEPTPETNDDVVVDTDILKDLKNSEVGTLEAEKKSEKKSRNKVSI